MNGRPIASFGSFVEMCAGTVDMLMSSKGKESDHSMMRNLTMSAPIVLDTCGANCARSGAEEE